MGVYLKGVAHETIKEISLWWWEPLWFYICENCDDILASVQVENGYREAFMGEGVWITAEQAAKIANRLETLSAKGKVVQYEKRYSNDIHRYRDSFKWLCYWTCDDEQNDLVDCIISALPYKFSKKLVGQFAEFSRNSKGFEISWNMRKEHSK